MFPNYLFARFSPGRFLHLIRYSRGVRGIVGSKETPLPVEEQVIEEIRARLDEAGCVQLAEKSWKPGERVRVEEGLLAGWEGIFEADLDDHRRVVILLEGIRQARVVLERWCLQSAGAG